jgi:hypothetical protein
MSLNVAAPLYNALITTRRGWPGKEKDMSYRMNQTKGATKIGHYIVKVYRVSPKRGRDNVTVCCDGGEATDRPSFDADDNIVWMYIGETYRDIQPGSPGVGKLVHWKNVSDSLKASIARRLT